MATFTTDFFAGTAFEGANLSSLIMRAPFNPRLCSEENWFNEESIFGDNINIQGNNGVLTILPVSQKGTEETDTEDAKRDIRNFTCPRIASKKKITNKDVTNILSLSGVSQTDKQTLMNQKLAQIREDIERTIEIQRIAATGGSAFYSVGDVATGSLDVIDAFGTGATATRQLTDFVLGTAGTSMYAKFMDVHTKVLNALGDIAPREIIGLATPTWFDALIQHADFKSFYKDNQIMIGVTPLDTSNQRYLEIRFKPNFRIIRYTGTGITAGDVNFFPSEGSLKTYWGASDYIDHGSALGQRVVADQERADRFGWDVYGNSTGFHLAQRPWSCVRGYSSN